MKLLLLTVSLFQFPIDLPQKRTDQDTTLPTLQLYITNLDSFLLQPLNLCHDNIIDKISSAS